MRNLRSKRKRQGKKLSEKTYYVRPEQPVTRWLQVSLVLGGEKMFKHKIANKDKNVAKNKENENITPLQKERKDVKKVNEYQIALWYVKHCYILLSSVKVFNRIL